MNPILVRSHIVLLGTSEVLEKGVPVNALWLPHRIRKPWGWGVPVIQCCVYSGGPHFLPAFAFLCPLQVNQAHGFFQELTREFGGVGWHEPLLLVRNRGGLFPWSFHKT